MSSSPTHEEHRDWFTNLLPFAAGEKCALVILRQPAGDPQNPGDYFKISGLNEEGLTVTPDPWTETETFFFSWAESAAMELDIGCFLTGEIDFQQLEAKHPHAWVGLSLAFAAEQELIRREKLR